MILLACDVVFVFVSDDDDDNVLVTPRVIEKEIPEMISRPTSQPKSRPISATRKQSETSIVDSVESQYISAAIAEENEMLMSYQQRRKTKTTPVTSVSDEAGDECERPSRSLSEREIFSITQRVRSLSGPQQKKLIQMLGEIDLAGGEILDQSWDERKDQNKQYLAGEKNNRSDLSSVSSPSSKIPSSSSTKAKPSQPNDEKCESMDLQLSTNTQLSSDDSEVQIISPHLPNKGGVKCVEVVLELHSNWGNEEFIGLTEVQFFDTQSKLIKVLPEDLSISGTDSPIEELKNICNSKTKTTRDKYMWKCPYRAGKVVKIVFSLKGCEVESLGKILVWNFNKNLQELSTGVKNCHVFLNRELKWEGVIDKGCGNQIFDYSTLIPINIPQKEKRNQTKTAIPTDIAPSPHNPVIEVKDSGNSITTMSKRHADTPQEEVFSDSLTDSSFTQMKSSNVSYSSSETPVSSLSQPKISNTAPSHSKAPALPNTTTSVSHKTESSVLNLLDDLTASPPIAPNTCSSPDASKKRGSETNSSHGNKSKKAKDSSQSSRSSSSMSDKPIWFEDMSNPKFKEDLFLEGKKVSLNSTRRSHQSSPDIMEEPAKRRPISGRRSQQQTPQSQPSQPTTADHKLRNESEDDFDVDSFPKQIPQRREGVRNRNEKKRPLDPVMSNRPGVHGAAGVAKSERAKFKETMDKNLELSFQSITNFNSRQRGRITNEMDDDDDLRSLLQPMKPQDVLELRGKSISPQPDLKRDQEMVDDIFEFPVLPHGKELIINIKSTWGDRHYVGLNGIEVFSRAGNLVRIKSIHADPSDINVLTEFDDDPRVVTNLVDNCYLTRDDLHLWLTPFTKGGDHFVELEFEEEV